MNQLRRYLTMLVSRLSHKQWSQQERHNAFGINVGEGTTIKTLRKLQGAQYISVGSYSSIGEQSWLAAFDQYAGLKYTPRLIIGDNVYIGDYACITCIDRIVIGDGCLLSEFVYISDHVHGFDPDGGLLSQQVLSSKGPVLIGANTFLGYRVCVLSGVSIGNHCVVGANSVVTRSVPDYCMLAGVPARVIKRYSRDTRRWLSINETDEM